MKKLRRDLWSYKSQFASVFVMTFLCLLVYSGIEGLWNSMDTNSEKYFKETNLADAWITTTGVTTDQLLEIKRLNGVEDVDRQVFVSGEVIHKSESADFQIISSENNNVSSLRVVSGEDYHSDKSGVWLDRFYADALNLNVGDTIQIEVADEAKKIRISGIVMNPEYIGYTGPGSVTPTDHKSYGYMVVGRDLFESLIKSPIVYNRLKLKLEGESKSKVVRNQVNDILEDKMVSYIDRETNPNLTYFTSKIESIKKVSILFSIIFLLLALLTIYSTISRLVSSQRIQIGTLIAMGFSRSQILFHYLSYGMLISLLGTVSGYACSFYLGNLLIRGQQKFHVMPSWDIPISARSLILVIAVILICSLGALVASYKLVVSNPALIMKNQNSQNSGNKKEVNVGFLGYEWNWVIRDIFRTKLRFLIGVIGVLGSVVLILSAIGLRDSVRYSNHFVYGTVFSYQSKVNVSKFTDRDAIETLDNFKGQWIQESIVEIDVDSIIETTNITVISEGDFIELGGSKPIHLNSEQVMISKKLADRLGISVNDTIAMKDSISSSFKKYDVSKIIEIPFPQGIYVSERYWEGKGNDFLPTSYLTAKNVLKGDNDNITSITTLEEQFASTNEIMQSIYSVIIAMIFASILLSIVILYNLGMLKFVERTKEYSTLKVLGFKNSELFKLIVFDSIPSLFVGAVFGMIVGIKFLGVFVSLVSTNVRGYLVELRMSNIVITLAIVIGCTFLVNYGVYRKLRKLNLVDSLKSSE